MSSFLIEMNDLLYIINEKGETEMKHYYLSIHSDIVHIICLDANKHTFKGHYITIKAYHKSTYITSHDYYKYTYFLC